MGVGMSLRILPILALGMASTAAAQDSYKLEKLNDGPPAGLAPTLKETLEAGRDHPPRRAPAAGGPGEAPQGPEHGQRPDAQHLGGDPDAPAPGQGGIGLRPPAVATRRGRGQDGLNRDRRGSVARPRMTD